MEMEIEKLTALRDALRTENPTLDMGDWEFCAIGFAKRELPEHFEGLHSGYLSHDVREFLGLESIDIFTPAGYHSRRDVNGREVADKIDVLLAS